MRHLFFCPISDPLFLGCSIVSSSLDTGTLEYIKLYGFRPCVVYDAPIKSCSRESFLSNLKFVDYIKKSKLQKIKLSSTNVTEPGYF